MPCMPVLDCFVQSADESAFLDVKDNNFNGISHYNGSEGFLNSTESIEKLEASKETGICYRDGAREEMLVDKIVKVPTASEASNVFTDHTFLIGSKFDKNL